MPKTPLDVAETGDRALAQDTGTVTAARADITRLGRIVAVLTRHGFHQFVKRRRLLGFLGKAFIPADDEELLAVDQPGMAAVRFRKVLSELGPTFIKLGQVLSTRPDLLPAEFVRELERLQDDAPPLPVEQIKQKIESELGIPLTEAFAHFEEEPLASASIGQVHRARTHDGDEVVVKVVRPGVNELIEADLDLLHLMARILEATFQEMSWRVGGDVRQSAETRAGSQRGSRCPGRVRPEYGGFGRFGDTSRLPRPVREAGPDDRVFQSEQVNFGRARFAHGKEVGQGWTRIDI